MSNSESRSTSNDSASRRRLLEILVIVDESIRTGDLPEDAAIRIDATSGRLTALAYSEGSLIAKAVA